MHREALHHFLDTAAVCPLTASQALRAPSQGIHCPSGIGSHSLYMHGAETTLGGLYLDHTKQWVPTSDSPADEIK